MKFDLGVMVIINDSNMIQFLVILMFYDATLQSGQKKTNAIMFKSVHTLFYRMDINGYE